MAKLRFRHGIAPDIWRAFPAACETMTDGAVWIGFAPPKPHLCCKSVVPQAVLDIQALDGQRSGRGPSRIGQDESVFLIRFTCLSSVVFWPGWTLGISSHHHVLWPAGTLWPATTVRGQHPYGGHQPGAQASWGQPTMHQLPIMPIRNQTGSTTETTCSIWRL